MSSEIKIEKKASEVIQPLTGKEAQQAIRSRQDLSGASLRGMSLNSLTAVGAILRKTDLTAADLSHSLLVNPNFYKANVHGASVHNTVLLGADLVKTSFKDSDLSNSALVGVDAQEVSFENTVLRDAALVKGNFKHANFRRANLANARLASLDVTGADFTDTNLDGARAYNVNWDRAKVQPSTIPQPFVKLPNWAWILLLGGLLGLFSLLVYILLMGKKKKSD